MRRLNGFNVDTAWKCWVLKDDHHKVVDGRTVTGLHNRTDTSIEGGWRYISKTLMTITMTIMMVMMVMTIMIMIMHVCQHTGPWQTWASPWVRRTRRRRSLVTQITSHSARLRFALSQPVERCKKWTQVETHTITVLYPPGAPSITGYRTGELVSFKPNKTPKMCTSEQVVQKRWGRASCVDWSAPRCREIRCLVSNGSLGDRSLRRASPGLIIIKIFVLLQQLFVIMRSTKAVCVDVKQEYTKLIVNRDNENDADCWLLQGDGGEWDFCQRRALSSCRQGGSSEALWVQVSISLALILLIFFLLTSSQTLALCCESLAGTHFFRQ